jgi:DNA gyrase/topoisomerase IV subunit B
MNVTQASIKDVLDNQEFSDIMASVGLVIGQPAAMDELRYSKIVFLADSDVDGGHINTLLTNFFFTYWPELFENGCIQIAKAPLFEIITNKDPIYAESERELESIKSKPGVVIKEIQRNKGLGEMSPEAFRYVLSREDYTRITVDNMDDAKYMLHTCFGKDTQLRKDLLLDEDKDGGGSKSTTKKVAKTVAKKVVKKTAKKVAKKTSKKTTKKVTRKR